MTIDEAIEILSPIIKAASEYPHDDYYRALNLSFEALKRTKNDREVYSGIAPRLLPGETE